MADAITGFQTAVLLQREKSYGDGGDSAYEQNWLEFTSESLTESHDLLEPIDSRSAVRRDYANQGQLTVSGGFDIDANAENVGWLYFFLLGSSDISAIGSTDSYSHTLYYHNAAGDIPTVGLETDYGVPANDTGKHVYGARISGVTLDVAEGLVTASADVDAQRMNPDKSTRTQTFTNWPRGFDFKDFSMTIEGTDVTIDIISGSVEMTRDNMTDDYRQRDQYIHSMPIGPLTVTADFDIAYDDGQNSTVRQFLDGETTSKTVTITYTGDEIGSTGNNYQLQVRIPNAYTTDRTPEVSGPGERVERSVTLEGFYDYSNSTVTQRGVEVTLQNSRNKSYDEETTL